MFFVFLKFPEYLALAFFQPEGDFFGGGEDFLLSEPACDGALPDHADPPSFFEQLFNVADVALSVAGELLSPEIGICPRHSELFAFERVEYIFFEKAGFYQVCFLGFFAF